MRRSALVAVSLVITISIAGCAGRTVDEELLPTLVPTLDTQALAQAAEAARPTRAPTATPTPLPPTPEPTSASADDSEASSAEPESAAESVSVSVIEYGGVVTDSQEESTTVPVETEVVAEADEEETTEPVGDAADVAEETRGTEGVETSEATAEGSETITATVGVDDALEVAEEVDPKFAGMPQSMIAAIAAAEPDNGEMLTLSTGCSGCHSTDPNQFMAGPTWYNMAEVAANRVEGESPGLYLYNSIIDPNGYLVDEYLPNIMLQTYVETLPEEDMADIIAYLLTIRGR